MDSTSLGPLRVPLYLIALLLVAMPLFDFATSIYPLQVGNLQWRFGTSGLLAGFLFTPMLGLAFLAALAHLCEDRVVARLVAAINLILAVVLVVAMLLFALDALQLRREVAPGDARTGFYLAALRSAAKFGACSVAFLVLGIGGIRGVPAGSRRRDKDEAAPLIVS